MKKTIVRSDKIGGSYTNTTIHATRTSGLLFVTGQIANRPGTAPAGSPLAQIELGSIEEQTVQVMENVKAILEEAGTTFDNVLKRNVYIPHLADFETVYGIMERYFPSGVASTGVLAGLIPPGARVEVDVIAAIPEEGD